MSGASFHCHVFKDRTLKTQETPTDNQGNTLIWRLNQEVGGFGVTHRLPLAPHSAKWWSGQNRGEKTASPDDVVVFTLVG